MALLRGLLDRLLLVAAAITGGLIPGFISQYRQRLGGRLDQARVDLASWQKIADQFFQGSLDKLIQNHQGSTDPAIQAEAHLVQSLVTSVHNLQDAVDALNADLWHQVAYLTWNADPELMRATFSVWSPTFSLTAQGLLLAAAVAALVWLLFQLIWWLVVMGLVDLASPKRQYDRPPRRYP